MLFIIMGLVLVCNAILVFFYGLQAIMMSIGLFRHGATVSVNRYVGSTEIELSPAGIAEVRRQQAFLAAQKFDRIFCSPMQRCLQTFRLLQFRQECTVDERLREIDFGAWEGRTFEEIAGAHPDLVAQWGNNPDDFGFPQGERIRHFYRRVQNFCELLPELASENILLITHGGVIRHMICFLLGLPAANYLYFKIDTAHLTTLQLYSQGAVLTGLNRGREDG